MTDTTREAVARAMEEAEVGYSLKLTRLVDDVSTYTLTFSNTDERLEFDDIDEAYALIARRKRETQADAALAALRHAQDAEGWVMVPVGHLKEALRFYPPFDHDIKTRLIGDELREIAASPPRTLEAKPTSPGPVNCTHTLRREGKAYPRTCQRCGLGPCPFYSKDGSAK